MSVAYDVTRSVGPAGSIDSSAAPPDKLGSSACFACAGTCGRSWRSLLGALLSAAVPCGVSWHS